MERFSPDAEAKWSAGSRRLERGFAVRQAVAFFIATDFDYALVDPEAAVCQPLKFPQLRPCPGTHGLHHPSTLQFP